MLRYKKNTGGQGAVLVGLREWSIGVTLMDFAITQKRFAMGSNPDDPLRFRNRNQR